MMSFFDGLKHRVRVLLDPGTHERELDEEMRFHEELDVTQQRDAYRARRRFGNRTYHREEARRMTLLRFVDVLRQDTRHAWRSIARTPGFTAMVIATLALGIGVNAAMFSFLDRVFLRPPAGVAEPSTLRRLWITRYRDGQAVTYQGLNFASYAALKDVGSATAELALFNTDNTLHIGRDRESPPVHAVYATSNYFSVLGLRPESGRFYAADEDVMGAGADVAVVSHDFWRTRLAGDSGIIGKTITLGRTPYVIIGIMAPKFVGLDVQPADIWIPLGAFPARARAGRPWYQTASTYGSRAVMRVKPGFDDDGFAARAAATMQRVERDLPGTRPNVRMALATGSIIEARGPGELGPETVIATRLGGVAIIVLLIACANVVNLLLARSVHRRREIAVRLALGVSRSRLVRLLTTETVLLALLAAGAAILAAWWGGGVLRTLLMPDIEWTDSSLDGRVVAFALGVSLLAGFVAGIIPAVQASNPQLTSALKSGAREGGMHRSRLRSALVVVQAAFSVVLLVGAALFVRTLQNVRGIDVGYDIEPTLMAEVRFEDGEQPAEAVVAATMGDIATRLEARPGVEAIGRAAQSPMRGYGVQWFTTGYDSLGTVSSDVGPMFSAVSPGFFAASGLRVLRGRNFSGGEYGPAANEVILNDVAARALYPGRDPMGQCVRFARSVNPCHTVVGVVENTNTMALIEGKKGYFYVPLGSHAAASWTGGSLVLRLRPDAMASVRTELQRELRRAFPLGTPTVMSMHENLEDDYRPWKVGATMFTAFGLLALIVALVGIYSTVSYAVRQRTHEFGVRIALGARVRDVLNQVLGEGLRVVAIGVACGILLALAAGRLVRALLFGVDAADPSAMLLSACLLLLVAAVATLLPALRAARVDPVTALRAD
jgi:predicted permease